jgi:hypothetical protein
MGRYSINSRTVLTSSGSRDDRRALEERTAQPWRQTSAVAFKGKFAPAVAKGEKEADRTGASR